MSTPTPAPRVPEPQPTLVLWDIDLTLVDYSGIGRQWYSEALAAVVGKRLDHLPRFPGRTERSLAREVLKAHGAPDDDETVEQLFAALEAIATQARPAMPTLGRALAGAAEVLTALYEHDGVVQSLVTGNLPVLASYKLEAFDLHRHVDLDIGGYGSLSDDRHDLVEVAMTAAAAKHGVRFPGSAVVVIGDTPLDIAAGRHHGTTTVGVATGRHSVEELAASGAHAVLPDLTDTETVLATLLRGAGKPEL